MNRRTLLTFLIATLFAAPVISLAASGALQFSPPCVSVPGFPACAGPITATTPINVYLVRIYQFAMGISGITAVAMIIWGAIYISVYTERIDRKEEGREMILAAFEGIALLFGSYLLLRTINPEIVKLKEPVAPVTVPIAATSTPPRDCAEAATIPIDGVSDGIPAGGCDNKRLKTTSETTLSSDDFYSSSETLPAGTLVWLWPYFPASASPANARCLVYAYKKPPALVQPQCIPVQPPVCPDPIMTPSSVEMMKLNLDSLAKCTNGPTQPGAALSDTLTPSASAAQAQLNAHHVTLSSTGNCSNQQKTNCTSLEAMPQNAIDYLSNLGDFCYNGGSTKCTVTVTGGTEIGHERHCRGNPVFDLRSTDATAGVLGDKLKSDSTVVGICASDAQSAYRKVCAYPEGNDHFHVELSGVQKCPRTDFGYTSN